MSRIAGALRALLAAARPPAPHPSIIGQEPASRPPQAPPVAAFLQPEAERGAVHLENVARLAAEAGDAEVAKVTHRAAATLRAYVIALESAERERDAAIEARDEAERRLSDRG